MRSDPVGGAGHLVGSLIEPGSAHVNLPPLTANPLYLPEDDTTTNEERERIERVPGRRSICCRAVTSALLFDTAPAR